MDVLGVEVVGRESLYFDMELRLTMDTAIGMFKLSALNNVEIHMTQFPSSLDL